MFLPIRWNSVVKIAAPDVATSCGFSTGSVVGLFYVELPEQAETFGMPVGSKLLDVEGPDGSKVTVNLEHVELLEQ